MIVELQQSSHIARIIDDENKLGRFYNGDQERINGAEIGHQVRAERNGNGGIRPAVDKPGLDDDNVNLAFKCISLIDFFLQFILIINFLIHHMINDIVCH